jgi:hypothetical protein
MADYDADRWLSRQLAWENVLDRLREKAGVELPEEQKAAETSRRRPAKSGVPSPNKAA